MKYNIRFRFEGLAEYDLEANSPKEAIIKAFNKFKTDDPSANINEIWPDGGSAVVTRYAKENGLIKQRTKK